MSQNGPYPGSGWPAGGPPGSSEPYAEPADPWGAAADPSWGDQPPHVVPPPPDPSVGYGYPAAPLNTPPPWQQPPPAPRRRNGPIVALVVVLGLLICGGLGTTAFLVTRSDAPDPEAGRGSVPASRAPTGVAAPEPQTSQDARFVGKNECVRNEGNADDSPELTIVPCASGTYEVLKRVDGRTTGEQDAEGKCSKVANYTKWYFYDSELDSLDFVLCLREYAGK